MKHSVGCGNRTEAASFQSAKFQPRTLSSYHLQSIETPLMHGIINTSWRGLRARLADGSNKPSTVSLTYPFNSSSPQRPVDQTGSGDHINRLQDLRRALCGNRDYIPACRCILEDWQVHTIIQQAQGAERREPDHSSICENLVWLGLLGDTRAE